PPYYGNLFLSFSFFPRGVTAVTLEQPKLSITKASGKTAQIICKMSGVPLSAAIHWYYGKPGEELKRIMFHSTSITHDLGFRKEKFTSDKTDGSCTFIIHNIAEEDSATYYCAWWDYH
uniref:T cell receptor gamma variable 9 n=1 Tax=Latimeria chalumnae TaxID=7897 RepID=H2ZX67_LATCH